VREMGANWSRSRGRSIPLQGVKATRSTEMLNAAAALVHDALYHATLNTALSCGTTRLAEREADACGEFFVHLLRR
jgi:hypothetical protein